MYSVNQAQFHERGDRLTAARRLGEQIQARQATQQKGWRRQETDAAQVGEFRSVAGLVDNELVGNIESTVASIGASTAELSDATRDALEVTGAAALFDGA